jgi:hypothetical protein
MTRIHFIEMAAKLKNVADHDSRIMAAICFCDVARKANPRFDTNRFLAACGL